MTYFFKIKKEKQSDYSGLKAFIEYPHSFYEPHLSTEKGIYHYWRLAPNNQDAVVVTKIKLEDLELVNVYK